MINNILGKFANNTYHLMTPDIIRSILLIIRLSEWKGKRDIFSDETPWEFQEQIERALLYGKPSNLDELVKFLIPNEQGLWEHKLVSKVDIDEQNKFSDNRCIQSTYCVVCENDNNRNHAQKQNKFDSSYHSKNYEEWPPMNEDQACRTIMNNDRKCIKMDSMIIYNNSKFIQIGDMNSQIGNYKTLSTVNRFTNVRNSLLKCDSSIIQNLNSEEKYEKIDSIPSNTEGRYSKIFPYSTNYHLKLKHPISKKSIEVKPRKHINVEYINSNKSYELHSFGANEEFKDRRVHPKDSIMRYKTKQQKNITNPLGDDILLPTFENKSDMMSNLDQMRIQQRGREKAIKHIQRAITMSEHRLLNTNDDHEFKEDEEINNRYIAFENHPNKEYYDRVDRNYVQEEICQICGTHLEQHHEDYNFELVEIMHRFEKVFMRNKDENNEHNELDITKDEKSLEINNSKLYSITVENALFSSNIAPVLQSPNADRLIPISPKEECLKNSEDIDSKSKNSSNHIHNK